MQIRNLEDFITQMPKDLESTMEKARWLYIELGRRSFYDVSYKYLNEDEEQELVYDHKPYENPNIITCKSLSKQYSNLLTMAGIKNEIVENRQGHAYIIFWDEQGDWHTADITDDLKNIQSGCRTTHFAKGSMYGADLRSIDLKLGYISLKRDYTDSYWHILKETIGQKHLTGKEELKYILASFNIYVDIEKMGDTELFGIYKKFVLACKSDSGRVNFSSAMTKSENRCNLPKSKYGTKSGLENYYITYIDENYNETEYIYDRGQKSFVENCRLEEIEK